MSKTKTLKRTRPRASAARGPAAVIAPSGAEPGTVTAASDDHSAFTLYLREVGQTRLLTPAEELALAKRIRRGDKQAREEFIKANLRLVVKIARDYENYGVPLLDLISEGNIGLMKAVDRFDPKRGAKFSTYAAWWIKQSVRRALTDLSRTIRVPVHVVDKLSQVRRASAKLVKELGREPTDEELAQEVGLDRERLEQYRNAPASMTSLDAPLGDDDDNRVAEVVADEKASTPFQELAASVDTDLVRKLVAGLNEREASILRRRFGLDGEEKETLEEVGRTFGVTRERIRQIEEGAIQKLRRQLGKLDALHFAA